MARQREREREKRRLEEPFNRSVRKGLVTSVLSESKWYYSQVSWLLLAPCRTSFFHDSLMMPAAYGTPEVLNPSFMQS